MAGKVETFVDFCLAKKRKVPGCLILLNKIFVLIKEKATAAGNKVSTLNKNLGLSNELIKVELPP